MYKWSLQLKTLFLLKWQFQLILIFTGGNNALFFKVITISYTSYPIFVCSLGASIGHIKTWNKWHGNSRRGSCYETTDRMYWKWVYVTVYYLLFFLTLTMHCMLETALLSVTVKQCSVDYFLCLLILSLHGCRQWPDQTGAIKERGSPTISTLCLTEG